METVLLFIDLTGAAPRHFFVPRSSCQRSSVVLDHHGLCPAEPAGVPKNVRDRA